MMGEIRGTFFSMKKVLEAGITASMKKVEKMLVAAIATTQEEGQGC